MGLGSEMPGANGTPSSMAVVHAGGTVVPRSGQMTMAMVPLGGLLANATNYCSTGFQLVPLNAAAFRFMRLRAISGEGALPPADQPPGQRRGSELLRELASFDALA